MNKVIAMYLFATAFLLTSAYGWIWNLVKILDSGMDVWNGLLIARVIGVFVVPVGAVLGFL